MTNEAEGGVMDWLTELVRLEGQIAAMGSAIGRIRKEYEHGEFSVFAQAPGDGDGVALEDRRAWFAARQLQEAKRTLVIEESRRILRREEERSYQVSQDIGRLSVAFNAEYPVKPL